MNLISFPKAQSVIVSGDIHGDFTQLVFKVCVQYDMYDTLVIVAGDCGFGFEKEAYYEQVFRRVQKRLTAHNCWIVMMRGNHDDPSYFSESKISHERFQTIPDYTIIEAIGQHILCVGGAISMDRMYRKSLMLRHPNKMYYWSDEAPIYNEAILREMVENEIKINAAITHTAPSFCEFITKNGLMAWAADDPTLLEETNAERRQLDLLHTFLVQNGHPVRSWFYGHFHHSWHAEIEGIRYYMLDILELHTLQ